MVPGSKVRAGSAVYAEQRAIWSADSILKVLKLCTGETRKILSVADKVTQKWMLEAVPDTRFSVAATVLTLVPFTAYIAEAVEGM